MHERARSNELGIVFLSSLYTVEKLESFHGEKRWLHYTMNKEHKYTQEEENTVDELET